MPREFFCAYCGTQLNIRRKALKNKAIIIDLVDTHECDENNISNITDSAKPIAPIIKEFHEAERRAAMPILNEDDRVFSDARTYKKEFTSTAPASLNALIKSGPTSGPERKMVDLDGGEK